ncbi:LysR family transcriptional regulator [Mesorhizobium sp. M8A.F.Ca.ET.208.01.1.1]|nr:LysR family transcriptional regulator [Mesorhizobium sp. M8A.F.Ca.ET.059.01.1.1]TGQ95938.1 LysR family transcriptional regulator [Mesorhizobium sp. M8A.F.Ca.ET.208.01.1.1]TGT56429.1 LysR family transcriptional regulator [Mesorhizobium sp. M8A.F.Ca.ET.167.01.1.1]
MCGVKFELRHLRYVLAAAEQRSFRRAARSLSVEPSTISRRIRDLEDDIGAALFIRAHDGVSLTVAGERFIRRARKALNQLTHATLDASAIGRGQAGIIRIGLTSSIASGFIAKLLDAYGVTHAEVQIEYVEGQASQHVPAIQQHQLDVAFLTGTPAAEDCDVLHLWNERIFVAMSGRHELAGKDGIAWSDLRDREFIVSEAQSGQEIHDCLVKHLAELGHSPSVQKHAVYRDTLMQIVAGGSSLTLTSEATIAAQFPGVVYRPLTGEVLPFCAVWSPRNDNPAFRRFLSLAKVISKRCEASVVTTGVTGPSESGMNGSDPALAAPLQSPDPSQ